MANLLPNQPIVFDQPEDCWLEDSGLKVLAEYGDITQFQLQLEPCGTDVNVIRNGNFDGSTNWTVGLNWDVFDGNACHTSGIYGVLSQIAPVADGVLIRLTFDLSVTESGCVVQYGTYLESFTVSGSYTRWIVADSAAVFSVGSSFAVCISNVQVMTINTNFSVAIVDEDLTPIEVLLTADGYFNFEDGYFTASIDWEALAIPDGCYHIGVVDPCPCANRGIIPLDFETGLFNWSLAASWSISNGIATYNGSTAGQAILNHVVCDEVSYSVTYTLSGMGGNDLFNVRLGAQNGVVRSTNGTFTETIVSSGTSFIMIGNSSSGTQTFEVTNMYIERTTVEYYLSNLIHVKQAFNCQTIALALCNDSDALGFGFVNTGFRPLMRIPASLNRSNYPMERLAYDNSQGRKATYYARSRKARELGFDGKEFMHDFAMLFGQADHFYIDDVEYFVEDDEYPSISWDGNEDSGGVTINVSIKTQLIENRRLSSASVGCQTGGSPLLDNRTETITDQADSAITTP